MTQFERLKAKIPGFPGSRPFYTVSEKLVLAMIGFIKQLGNSYNLT